MRMAKARGTSHTLARTLLPRHGPLATHRSQAPYHPGAATASLGFGPVGTARPWPRPPALAARRPRVPSGGSCGHTSPCGLTSPSCGAASYCCWTRHRYPWRAASLQPPPRSWAATLRCGGNSPRCKSPPCNSRPGRGSGMHSCTLLRDEESLPSSTDANCSLLPVVVATHSAGSRRWCPLLALAWAGAALRPCDRAQRAVRASTNPRAPCEDAHV
jgi:hypothetical protein